MNYIENLITARPELISAKDAIAAACELICEAHLKGGKLLL